MQTYHIELVAKLAGLLAINIAFGSESVQVSTRGHSDSWQVFSGQTLDAALGEALSQKSAVPEDDEIEDLLA